MTEKRRAKHQSETLVYLQHILGLWPGKRVPVFRVHPGEIGSIDDWQDSDLTLVIEEGRRQLDRQVGDLERVRGRAQSLLTVTLPLLALVLAGVKTIADSNSAIAFILWSVGILTTMLAILGTAAVVVVRKELGVIDVSVMTRFDSDVRRNLAREYAESVATGENTIATHITVYRDAVFLLVFGATFYAVAWILAVFQ